MGMMTITYPVNFNTGGGEPDGSTTVKGIVQFATLGESTALEALQSNDPRLPTQAENDGLTGKDFPPSSTNPFLTEDDVAQGIDAGSFV